MVNTIHPFTFTPVPGIIFGAGSINQLVKFLGKKDERILLVTGNRSFGNKSIGPRIETLINSDNNQYFKYSISNEPSPANIDDAIAAFRDKNITKIIAVGGGSVIDAGKAIAAMFCENGPVREFLEGVGTKQPSGNRIYLIAIPTTSGTGSEVTKNAVISEYGTNGFKKSLRHDNYVPDVAIIDPELILECPKSITGSSGMDAFTQLLESYLSVKSSPVTDALAYSGLERIARSLKTAFEDGQNIEARSDMAYAALMSGITLANAGLGLVHGFAQPLGSLFPIPHGVVCSIMMASVNRLTVNKLKNDLERFETFKKYAEIGKLFTAFKNKSQHYYADLIIDTIENYNATFKIPKLSEFGVTRADFSRIIERTEMKNHPVQFDNMELNSILELSL